MDANLQKILSEALKLTDDQKAELASELHESIERPFRKEVEESWAREIERRLAAMESGEVKGIPWSEVRRRVFGKSDDTAAA